MAKFGRNDPCPCGSGKKFKKCCNGLVKTAPAVTKLKPNEVPPEIKKILARQKADELTRQQQQGLGKPIISAKFKGQTLVAIGSKLYVSQDSKTFPDFLFSYLPTTMGKDWSNSELKKPLENRHPIMQWYDGHCRHQQKYWDKEKSIQSLPSTGVVNCYLGLAYNLYLLDHNVELQSRLVHRLKDIKNFQGAYYELIIANCLIRAGFELSLEDETDEQSKHCEFSAVSIKTKKKYWVEAKARSVAGILGKTEVDGTKSKDPTVNLSKHVTEAFQKPAADERLIFVDVNSSDDSQTKPAWIEKAGKKLDMREKDLLNGQAAYVFVTNMNFHWHLDSEKRPHGILGHGLGIKDFGKVGFFGLSEIYRAKQKHIDAHNILEAFREYPKIPSTLDGSLPSEAFSENPQPIKIGETYFFNDIGDKGLVATVTTATVNEVEKRVYLGTDKGQILIRPMSEEELADYKNHPDTYFGVVLPPGKKTDDPYELFEYWVEVHLKYSRENILERLKQLTNTQSLTSLSHEELVLLYCERLVASVVAKNPSLKISY